MEREAHITEQKKTVAKLDYLSSLSTVSSISEEMTFLFINLLILFFDHLTYGFQCTEWISQHP